MRDSNGNIIDPNLSGTQKVNVGAAVENNQTNQQNPGQPGDSVFSPSFVGSDLFGAPFLNNSYSAIVNGFITKLKEVIEKQVQKNSPYEFSVLGYDRQNSKYEGLLYSVVVLVGYLKNNPNTILYYPYLLAGTNSSEIVVNRNINPQTQVEVTILPSDAFDNNLHSMIRSDIYSSIAKNPGAKVDFVDGMVVPPNFDMENDNNARTVAFIGAFALGTNLSMEVREFKDVNICDAVREWTAKGQLPNFQMYVNYGRQIKTSMIGLPVRSDVRLITKRITQTKANQNDINRIENGSVMNEINGFIDLVWVGGNEVNPMLPVVGQQKFDNYAARFVITDIDSLKAYTPAYLLFSVASTYILANDDNYIMAFRPQSADKKNIDITDIGALGYENNITGTGFKKIDTKAADFTMTNLYQLVKLLIKPGLTISVDVPHGDIESWYMKIFSYGVDVEKFRNKIIQAANRLTDNNFGLKFGSNDPIFAEVSKIHMGYYTDRNGQIRDLRELDYLAAANFYGPKDPSRIKDWSDTFITNMNIPIDILMAERKKMILEMTNGMAQFTGYATRITFTPKFIAALVDGISACGLRINLINPLNATDFNQIRRSAYYDAQAATFNSGGFITPNVNYGVNNGAFNVGSMVYPIR